MPTLFKKMDVLSWAKLYLTCSCCLFIVFSVTFLNSYNIFAVLLICSYAFFISPRLRNEVQLSKIEKSLMLIMLFYIASFLMEVILFGSDIRILDKPAKVLLLIPLIPLLNASKVDYRYLISAFLLSSGLLLCMAGYDKYILGYTRVGQDINAIQFGAIAIAIGSTALLLAAIFIQRTQVNKLQSLFLFLLAFGGVLAGVLSQSKGSILAIPITMLLIGLLYFPLLNFGRAKVLLISGLILALGSITFYNSSVMNRFESSVKNTISYSNGANTNTSSGVRLGLWKVSFEAGSLSPIVGLGYKGFVDYKNKQVTLGHYGKELLKYDNAHNSFMNAFALRGLIGLSAVIIFLGFPIYLGIKIWRRESKEIAPYAVGLTAFGSVFFIANITQEVIFLNTGIIMYTGLLVILTSLLAERIKSAERSPGTEEPKPHSEIQ